VTSPQKGKNWMQNNSIFLELVAKLNIFGFNRLFKKILITARRLLKVVTNGQC
jgi:hypothetical protein